MKLMSTVVGKDEVEEPVDCRVVVVLSSLFKKAAWTGKTGEVDTFFQSSEFVVS